MMYQEEGPQQQSQSVQPQSVQPMPTDAGQQLMELMEALQRVEIGTPEAKLNETSISDNNGGRIELSQDLSNTNDFHK